MTPSDSSGRFSACSRISSTTARNLGGGALVGARFSSCEYDEDVPDGVAAVDAGEGGQSAVVEVDIGEGDEALIAAAVVPREHAEVDEWQQRVED